MSSISPSPASTPSTSGPPELVTYQNGEAILNVRSHDSGVPFMPEGQNATNLGPAAAALGVRAPNPAVHGEVPSRGKPGADTGAGASQGGEGPSGPPGKSLDKFAYGFWAPELKPFRKIVFKIFGMTLVLSILVMWVCLPAYWGSLWKSNTYTRRLTVRVINQDNGEVGQAISTALLSQTALYYFTTPPTQFATTADLENDIVNEGAWAAVVINAGATDALEQAWLTGNASYNGSEAVSVYYSQARNENAENSYLVPILEQTLGAITEQLGATGIATYLKANAGNATAIGLLAQAPLTVTQPLFYTLVNLRPYNQPVATAITLVGLIYMLIFAFIITMTNNAVREIISPFLTTKSYILYRIIAPMTLYLPLSFFFSMVNLPFKVHFDAHFTYAGGFFLWAFILFLGMSSVGLATEFAITILGPKFMAFFLVPLIIVNVSVASFPHELQPRFYRYGVAMPFYNVGRAVRTIIFDTKNELGRNIGILLGWIGLSLITIALATWLFRRNSVNAHRKAMAESEMDEKLPDGRVV